MDHLHTVVRTVDLGYDQLLMLHGRPGTRVKVLFGGIWLTEEGEAGDIFATRGGEVTLRSSKRAVIEGLGPTRVHVIEPHRQSGLQVVVAAAAAWIGRVRTAWQRLRLGRRSGARGLTAVGAIKRCGEQALCLVPTAPTARLMALAIAIGIGLGVPELIAKQFALDQIAGNAARPVAATVAATKSAATKSPATKSAATEAAATEAAATNAPATNASTTATPVASRAQCESSVTPVLQSVAAAGTAFLPVN
jgi:hypothetical protein